MKLDVPQINLVSAWIGMLLGFLSGLALGLFFQRDNWLGGYASLQRRLYRLAHISFFGLGATNLFFYLTARALPSGNGLAIASLAFVVGAISMPVCCVLMAHFRRAQILFAIPVVAGAVLTLVEVIKS